jgi:methylenetetrahydrofolate reductase (NADPH)
MNLAQATRMTLEELNLLPEPGSSPKRLLPWRQSLGLHRREEDVRPIFWKNRDKSYVTRTQDWDEFPNGRWGDARSPAYGHLDTYGIGLRGSNEQNIKLWGSPRTLREVSDVFVRFLSQDLEKLPWTETGLSSEAGEIREQLVGVNHRGFLTINSQPAVNGVRSNDPVHGWGPANGYVYQKAYLEFLCPPEIVEELVARADGAGADLTYYAVNRAGDMHSNAPVDGPNAVTWGVFPGKEIVQPTIVERISFEAWKDEAFKLGTDWAHCHPVTTPSRHLLLDIMNHWYLVNIVNNDFHSTQPVFDIFNGLEVPGLDREFPVPSAADRARASASATSLPN